MPTIKEVARLANCSISTVSYALNGSRKIRPETKQRIVDIAEELGYYPTRAARALKSKKTSLIGIFTVDYRGPFFSELLDCIAKSLSKYNYDMIATTCYDTAAKLLRERSVDGAVAIGTIFKGIDVSEAKKNNIPVFFLNSDMWGDGAYAYTQDNKLLFYSITKLLIDRGCKNIVYLSGQYDAYDNINRYEGYLCACNERNLPQARISGDFSIESGYNAVRELFYKNIKFDAVASANDEMAIGALKAFAERGVYAPRDIKITGYDNIEASKYCFPSLSTVSVDRNEWSKIVVDRLMHVISGYNVAPALKVSGNIIVRESTST